MVIGHIEAGRLKRLALAEKDAFEFRIHVVHERGREIGRAGRWLIADLREKLAGPACAAHKQELATGSAEVRPHPLASRTPPC